MPINAVNLTGNVYPAGPKGDTGPANILEIGTVEKGENASASITGEAPNQTLNLILPKGDKGEKGDTGETNSLSIGTVEKGTVPSATITGQAPNQILNLVLPKGDTGEKGEVGPRGEQGIQGNPGPINSIKIGRVEKGEEASVTIVGESPNQILNFVLPIGPKGNTGEKGDQGPKGEQGIQGETGATTSLSIGLVSSGEEASATIIGEAPDQILNLVLPKGDKGEKGNVGPQGVQGIQGETGPANSLTIGTVEKGAVPSATITGEAPNQVLNLVLPTGETAEIEAIKEEQTTQNENIEKNAEGIAQNKKDVDEELTKIKKENSLLKSQIPEGHASGNDIHLEDSSNMPFEWRLNGGSRQKTRSGKNVINVKTTVLSTYSSIGKDDWITIERTNTAETEDAFCNFFTKLTKELKTDTTYTIICEIKSVTTTSGGYLSITNDSTSFAFGATTPSKHLTELKAGDIIINKLKTKSDFTDVTNLLRTFVAVKPQSSVKIVFRLSVIEGDITDNSFEYESYGVSPSVEFLSEIKNVGNNINLYDKNNPNILNTPIDSNGTGVNVQNAYKTIWIPCKPNTTYTVSKIFDETKNRFGVGYSSIEPNYSQAVEGYISNEKANVLTVTTNATAKYLLAYVWIKGSSTTYEKMLDSIKIEEGIKATNYSDYNCGSVGVTISNKNLYKIEKVINDTNYSKIIYKDENGNVSFTTGGIPLIIAPTKTKEKTEYTYILKCKSNVTTENNINFTAIYEDATSELLSANKKKDTNEFIVKFKTDKEKTLAYVTQQYTNSSRTTIITKDTMILEGDYLNLEELYEIHQEQEILFPLAEGQKLYEGSYLAKDGIHNKRISINGNEYKNTAGMNRAYSTENYNCFDIYTGLKFVKSENQYKTIGALCNQFKEKNWASFWQQKVNEEGFCINQDNRSTIYIKISKEICPDIDTFKKYIDENNLLFEISLEQEEIIPYTPEQQAVIDKILYTYKNVTNISVDDELATLEISYKKDIETMFNNQAKECNERLSNIENLLNTTETSALLLDNLEDDLEKEV